MRDASVVGKKKKPGISRIRQEEYYFYQQIGLEI